MFHNERTRSTPLDPKLTFWCDSYFLGAFGTVWMPYETRCKTSTNFCTSSARFAQSFERQPNGPECTQIVGNTPKHQFRVQWGGSGVFVAKNSDATSWHKLLH